MRLLLLNLGLTSFLANAIPFANPESAVSGNKGGSEVRFKSPAMALPGWPHALKVDKELQKRQCWFSVLPNGSLSSSCVSAPTAGLCHDCVIETTPSGVAANIVISTDPADPTAA